MAALPATTQIMSTDGAMANIAMTPGRAGPVRMTVDLMDMTMKPITPQEVSVSLSNPAAGIEPITRQAVKDSEGKWQVDGLTLPIAGTWSVTVNALITDFRQADLEGTIAIRR